MAERFPYQRGLLIWYWNTAFTNNNVGDHPGQGEILPVDARPAITHWSDGFMMRPRLQAFDSTFGLSPTNSITLHKNGVEVVIPSRPAVPLFNDRNDYWSASDGHSHGTEPDHYLVGWSSVRVPKSGTQIRVTSETPGGFTQIAVSPTK